MAQTQSPYIPPSGISTPLATSFDTAAAAQSSALLSQSQSQPQSQPQPAAPDPDIFDILPALHELVNRLLAPVPGAPSAPGSQPAFPAQQSLEIHQLASEVSSVRARIRRARKTVKALDDVDRAIPEQEAEMQALRARIERQLAVLEGLRGG